MELNLSKKVALITGAGRGIGEAVALSMAKEGVKLICISKTKANLIKLKNKIDKINSEDNQILSLDLSKKKSIANILNFLNKKKINPDIIINNVGGNLGFTDPLTGLNEWEKVFFLNLFFSVELNKAIIPKMVKRKYGRIVHISSISALENQGPPSYCAAKAALNAYVRSVGRYVSKDNVILTSVMPGAIFTKGGYWDISKKNNPKHVESYLENRMAIKRFGTTDEISDFVTFLSSEKASFCAGSNFLIDGGQGRIFQEV